MASSFFSHSRLNEAPLLLALQLLIEPLSDLLDFHFRLCIRVLGRGFLVVHLLHFRFFSLTPQRHHPAFAGHNDFVVSEERSLVGQASEVVVLGEERPVGGGLECLD